MGHQWAAIVCDINKEWPGQCHTTCVMTPQGFVTLMSQIPSISCGVSSDLKCWLYAVYKHHCTLHFTLDTYTAYRMPLILCAVIWSTKTGNGIFGLGICSSLISHVSVKHCLCIHRGVPTLTCFVIDYHVNTDDILLLFRCIQPYKYF